MVEVAELIKRVVLDQEDPKKVAKDVADFRKDFQKVHYCFDNLTDAYEYINIREYFNLKK